MKRIALGIVGILILVAAIAYAFRERITLRMMERVVMQNLEGGLMAKLPDGLHVALCGAGSPLPDPERSGVMPAVSAPRSASPD